MYVAILFKFLSAVSLREIDFDALRDTLDIAEPVFFKLLTNGGPAFLHGKLV